ncbi:aminotransferase-like domain-containing protein [Flindersiella endophytica]
MEDLWASLDRSQGVSRGIEHVLRQAIRAGKLGLGEALPSSRVLAHELGVARGTVSAAYEQLAAEGYLSARQGAPVRVCWSLSGDPPPAMPAAPERPRFDLRPGLPSGSSFPRTLWSRATRHVLAHAPDEAFGYGDPQGQLSLRTALAGYLTRARGVEAGPDELLVCGGFTQALRLACHVLLARGATTVAVESPCSQRYPALIESTGLRAVSVRCDRGGLCVEELPAADAVLVTPAHQYPLGVSLSPARRSALIAWARATGALIIEDDYDGEFRYDRQPVGALQQLDPARVLYTGTASKTLAPGLRLGWLSLPGSLRHELIEAKEHADRSAGVLDQLTLAALLDSGGFDRHVRRMRVTYRKRRAALLRTLGELDVRIEGIAAGLHALVHLPADGPTERDVLDRAAERGVALGGLGDYLRDPAGRQAIIVGYGTPPEHAYRPALAELAKVLSP